MDPVQTRIKAVGDRICPAPSPPPSLPPLPATDSPAAKVLNHGGKFTSVSTNVTHELAGPLPPPNSRWCCPTPLVLNPAPSVIT